MLTATVKTTKTKIISYLCVALALIIGAILFFGGKTAPDEPLHQGINVEEVRTFLSSKGIQTLGEPKEKQITLPEEFDAALSQYNEMLREEGYDLKPYLGKAVTQYTFAVAEEIEVYVTVYTADGKIIAAEIENRITGEQKAID